MIGYLSGRVIEKKQNEIWLYVNGVGYRMKVAGHKLQDASVGDEVNVYIHTHVREDVLELYGFEDMRSLALFEMVIGVSGIGPKIGMAVVGEFRPEQVEKAIASADVQFFTSVSGIGKKGAQRLIVDLKGKLPSMKELDFSEDEDDVVYEALQSFGFGRVEIKAALRGLEEMSDEEKIREGLRRLGKR